MIEELRYTLICDGSSDKSLIPIIDWLLRSYLTECAIISQWADLGGLRRSLRDSLEKRIQLSLDLYPCEILFIHRDAERESYEVRVSEINNALGRIEPLSVPTVCVVPVRMTEAWLLCDVLALRKAASNPNGRVELQLPPLSRLEDQPDPKNILHNLLKQASELPQRRLRRFSVSDRVRRVSELIDDFSSLRRLPAFAALETELNQVISAKGW